MKKRTRSRKPAPVGATFQASTTRDVVPLRNHTEMSWPDWLDKSLIDVPPGRSAALPTYEEMGMFDWTPEQVSLCLNGICESVSGNVRGNSYDPLTHKFGIVDLETVEPESDDFEGDIPPAEPGLGYFQNDQSGTLKLFEAEWEYQFPFPIAQQDAIIPADFSSHVLELGPAADTGELCLTAPKLTGILEPFIQNRVMWKHFLNTQQIPNVPAGLSRDNLAGFIAALEYLVREGDPFDDYKQRCLDSRGTDFVSTLQSIAVVCGSKYLSGTSSPPPENWIPIWKTILMETITRLHPGTSGVLFASMTYPFPSGTFPFLTRHFVYKYLLLKKDVSAVSWYQYCSASGLAPELDWSYTPSPGVSLILQMLLGGTDTLATFTRQKVELNSQIDNIWYSQRRTRGPWKLISGLIIAWLPMAEARKISDNSFPVIIAALLVSLVPWTYVWAILERLVKRRNPRTVSKLETVFKEVKSAFGDIEAGEFRPESGPIGVVETADDSSSESSVDVSSESSLDYMSLPENPESEEIDVELFQNFGIKAKPSHATETMRKTLHWVFTAGSGLFAMGTHDALMEMRMAVKQTDKSAYKGHPDLFELFGTTCLFLCGAWSAPRLSEGIKLPRILANWASFTIPFFRSAIVLGARLEMKEFFTEDGKTPRPDLMERFSEVLGNWADFKDSQLGKAVKRLISFTIALPALHGSYKSYVKEGSDKNFFSLVDEIDTTLYNARCPIEATITSFIYVTRTIFDVVATGKLCFNLDIKVEEEYLRCYEFNQHVVSGAYSYLGLHITEIKESYIRLEKRLRKALAKETWPSHKVILERKLESLVKWNNALLHANLDGAPKRSPKAFFFSGPPGIGKTCMIENIDKILHNDLGILETRKMANATVGDKYQSTQTSATTSVLYDDLNPEKFGVNRDGSMVPAIIKAGGSIVQALIKAGVEEKGNQYDLSSFNYYTSNTLTGDMEMYANNLGAIARRFQDMFQCRLKPDYMKLLNGEEVPDIEKMSPHFDEIIPSFMLLRRYTMMERNGAATIVYLSDWMNNKEALKYIRDSTKAHFANQDKILKRATEFNPEKFCPHGCPQNVCYDCERTFVPPMAAEDGVVIEGERKLNPLHKMCSELENMAWCQNAAKGKPSVESTIPLFPGLKYNTGNLVGDVNNLANNHPALFVFLFKTFPNCAHNILTGVLSFLISLYQWVSTHFGQDIVVLRILIIVSAFVFFLAWAIARWIVYRYWRRMQQPLTELRTEMQTYAKSFQYYAWVLSCLYVSYRSVGFIRDMFKNTMTPIEGGSMASLYACGDEETIVPDEKDIPEEPAAVMKPEDQAVDNVDNTETLVVLPPAPDTKPMWIPPTIMAPAKTRRSKTTSLVDLLPLVKKNLATLRWKVGNAVHGVMGLYLNSQLIVLPYHTIAQFEKEFVAQHSIELNMGTRARRNVTIQRFATARIGDKDLAVCVVDSPFGDKRNLLPFITVSSGIGASAMTWVRPDPTLENIALENVLVRHAKVDYVTSTGEKFNSENLVYSTAENTFNGLCGSVLVHGDKGASIVGLHVCGSGTGRQGGAAPLSSCELLEAIDILRKKRCYVSDTEIVDPITAVGDKVIEVMPNVHYKNPVNFQPGETVVVKAIEKKFSPRSNVIPHPIQQDAFKVLRMEGKYKPADMNFNLNAQPLVAAVSADVVAFDRAILQRAVEDYVSVVPAAVKRYVDTFGESMGPLTIHTAINGVPGHPFIPGLKMSTSAGHPQNTKKEKVLVGEPGEHYLSEDLEHAYFEAMQNLHMGQKTGHIYNCTLKSEPIKKHKEGARLFQCPSIIGNILVKQYYQEPMGVITNSPDLFETAIGMDRASPKWIDALGPIYQKGYEQIDLDYKKYDQSQPREIRTAAVTVFNEIQKCLGWAEPELEMAERIAGEFLDPLVNIGGAVIIAKRLNPSGTNVTAHLSGIENCLMMRYTFYKLVNSMENFRDHVKMITMGDDNLMGRPRDFKFPEWTPEHIVQTLAHHGLTLTAGSKDEAKPSWKTPDKHAGFIKSEPWLHPELGFVVSCLEADSTLRPFDYCEEPSIGVIPHSLAVANNIYSESVLKGREEGELALLALRRLLRTAFPSYFADKALIGYGDLDLSYGEMVLKVREKFQFDASTIDFSQYTFTDVLSDNVFHFKNKFSYDDFSEDERCVLRRGQMKPEGEMSMDREATWVIGHSEPVSRSDTLRVYAGEDIVSLRALLKPFLEESIYNISTPQNILKGSYEVVDPNEPSPWNLLFLSFGAVRGGVNLLINFLGSGVIRVTRATRPGMTSSITQMGYEILDTRVNPSGVFTIPSYMFDRMFLTNATNALPYVPGYNISVFPFPNTPAAPLMVQMAAAEDMSLLQYMGPPVITKGRRRIQMKQESGELEMGLPTEETIANVQIEVGDATEERQEDPKPIWDPSIRIMDESNTRDQLYRDVHINTALIKPGAQVTLTFYPFMDWIADPNIRNQLRGIANMQVDLEVRIETAASSQYSGLLQMSLLPYNQSMDWQGAIVGQDTAIAYALKSNLSHVVHNVGMGGATKLSIPYFAPYDAIPVGEVLSYSSVPGTNPAGNYYNPVMLLDTVSVVQTTFASSDPVVADVYVRATRVSLGGLTSWQQQAGEVPSEGFSSRASVIGGAALSLSSILQSIPVLAVPLEMAGATINGVAEAARIFGYSRPLDMSAGSMIPLPTSSSCTYNSNLRGRTLALDLDQGVSIDGIIGGSKARDDMLISDVISKPFYLGTYTISSSVTTDQVLFTLNVGPQLFLTSGADTAMAGGGLMSCLFAQWYGSMHYSFDFVAPDGTNATFEFLHEPFAETGVIPTSATNKTLRCNLRQISKVNVTANWESNRGMLGTLENGPVSPINQPYSSLFYNGQITVKLVTPLTMAGTSMNNLDIIIYGWCDPNMCFSNFSPAGLNGYTIPNAEKTLLGTQTNGSSATAVSPYPQGEPLQPTNLAPPTSVSQAQQYADAHNQSGPLPSGTCPPCPGEAPSVAPSSVVHTPNPSWWPSWSPTVATTQPPSVTTDAPTSTSVPTLRKIAPSLVPTRKPVRSQAPSQSPSVQATPRPTAVPCSPVLAKSTIFACGCANGTAYPTSGGLTFPPGQHEIGVPNFSPVIGQQATLYGNFTGTGIVVTSGGVLSGDTITVELAGGTGIVITPVQFICSSTCTFTSVECLVPDNAGWVVFDSSNLEYFLPTDTTQMIKPTVASYTAVNGSILPCMEFPSQAVIVFTGVSSNCVVNPLSFTVIGEGDLAYSRGQSTAYAGITEVTNFLIPYDNTLPSYDPRLEIPPGKTGAIYNVCVLSTI